jgi:hypothetical protein
MRLNLSCEVGVHGRLGSRANSNRLLQIGLSSLCHPGYFGSKTFNVFLFPFQVVCADEDGKVCVADLQGLDLVVEPSLDRLPDCVGCGLKDVAGTRSVLCAEGRIR